MLQQCRKEWIQYVKQFDLKEKRLLEQFHHTFRVMEYSMEIARALHLKEEEIELIGVMGLLHDIGRFEQWTRYQTYHDQYSMDHGELGAQILTKIDFLSSFVSNIEVKNLILKVVQNHHKRVIDFMSGRELLYVQIIQDADKLDILKEQGNQITTDSPILNEQLIQSIRMHELCKDTEMKDADEDYILRSLAFVFDIHFDYTLQYLKETEIIENKIKLLEIYFPENAKIQEIRRILIDYIEKRLNIC